MKSTQCAVFALSEAEPLPGTVLEQLVHFLQSANLAEQPKLLLVVTRGAHDATREKFDASATLWGVVRSARIEMPRFVIKAVDVSATASDQEVAKVVQAELQGPETEVEVAYLGGQRCVPRVVEAPEAAATNLQRQDAMRDAPEESAKQVKKGLQVVTGGLGGLGLVAAEELAALGAPGLMLTSRSGRVAAGQKRLEEQLRRLQGLPGLTVQLKACDVGKESQVASLVKEAKDAMDPVTGWVRCSNLSVSPLAMSSSMAKDSSEQMAVDRTGQPDDRLVHVALLLTGIPQMQNSAVYGFARLIDGLGTLLNPRNHRPKRFQTWFTHFQLALKFDGDEQTWLLHRVKSGVEFHPCEELRSFSFGLHEVVPHGGSCSRAWTCDTTYLDKEVTWTCRSHVLHWLDRENNLHYSPVAKNCQHFCYDFYKDVIEHEQVRQFFGLLRGPFRNLAVQTKAACQSGLTFRVVHAAGVLERCPLAELDAGRLKKVWEPKAAGAWYLGSNDLETFVLFSSVSSTIGLAGAAAYAAANCYLDGLAAWRRDKNAPALSLKWGPVSEVGLTADAGSDNLEAMALKTLSPAQVGTALRLCLAGPTPKPEMMLARVDWHAFMREVGMEIPQFMELQSKTAGAKAATQGADSTLALLPLEQRRDQVLSSIRSAAATMGLEMDDNTPLMEAGIDSLSAVEFRNKARSLADAHACPSFRMFDYPTLTALADYVSTQLVPDTSVATAAPAAALPLLAKGGSEHIAVLGGACHLPGDSWSLEKFDFMLSQGVDCSIEMPQNRWDVDDYYDPNASTGLKMYVRHAAFIEGVELFAATAFNINKAEAETMDPQQRHLLEAAFEAFTAGGFSKGQLMGSYGGVFVGQDKCDWNRMITGAQSGPYAATGGSSSISANRISYVLGLKGPSATMDTACSSSLVAADTAAVTLRRRRSDLAVVCGVNMLLLPQTFVACCQAQMLSKPGRCRTFDDSASGYARGEGVGAHALERSGSQQKVVELRGSALNQDGRSSNLTSPNGPSQTAVVLAALAEAQVQAARHICLETHGTGTALGDPMEVGALQAALGGSGRTAPLQLGAAKTNVGHLEGGAGMVGLLKLASLLSCDCMPSNLHLHDLNQHIAEDIGDFAVQFPSEACILDSLRRHPSYSFES
ncbi:unnamed protein product [Effrenium voratum]|nr:unnamed protein product [Effrenium voratum]